MKTKKLLSIILSILLLTAVIPFGAFTASAEVVSGTCGDNVTWEYDTSTYTLTIAGTGAMNDYSSSYYNHAYVTTAPWCEYYNTMKTVVINSGVTRVGNYAFYNCTGLKSVTIGNGVTSIGGHAFYGCTWLTSITIGNGVTSIGGYAFYNCTGITSITIPDSVTRVGSYAFYNTAWYNNQSNGLVYAGKVAYKYKGTCPANVTIKDGTLGIADYAFSGCTGLKSITIPDSVMSIGKNAFSGCKGLTSITIPDSVTEIGGYAFYNCAGLTEITIPDSVTTIGDYAFYGCEKLKTVYYCGTAEQWSKVSIDSNNSYLTNAEIIIHPEHTYIPAMTAPTCTTQGFTTYTCSRCSDSYKDNYTYMSCGENCGFIIEGNTLYIHGTGNTDNDKTQASVPWYDYADSITEIVIDEGITKVGNYAFYCLENAKSITSKNNNLAFGKYTINNSNANITVFAENGGSLETYCTENGIAYIDPTITPELETVTANSITVKAVSGYEYSKDGATWQKSNKFTGLSPAREYTIYARYAATADIFDTVGAPLIVTTLKSTVSAPKAPDYQSHTDNSITLAPNDLYEYSKDGENWQKSSEFTGLSKNIIYRFYQRVAETETEYASEASAALIIAIPDKPVILEARYDSILVKLVDGFEYCLDDMVWQDSNYFDKLIDNTEYLVYQRLKAVEGEKVYGITSEYTAVTTDNSITHTHTLGEWLYNEQNHWQICADCGEKFDEAAHTPGDWITDIEPTTETVGHKHIECTVCGYVLAEEDIPQLPAYTPGDINDDGEVNNKDLTRLFQYLSEWDVAVNEAALDVNGDGDVNNKDLTRLFQYLSEWEVEIF